MDAVDQAILRRLQRDGRQTNRELAEALGIAPSTALERTRALRARGVITGFHAAVDLAALGRGVQALISIRIRPQSREAIETVRDNMAKLPETLGVFVVTGNEDVLVHVAVPSTQYLRDFVLDRLARRKEFVDVRTTVVFDYVQPVEQSELPDGMTRLLPNLLRYEASHDGMPRAKQITGALRTTRQIFDWKVIPPHLFHSIQPVQRNSLSAILIVLAAGVLWGTVGPAGEILAHSTAGPVAIGGARILSGRLVLTVIMLWCGILARSARCPGRPGRLLLAAAAATAIFPGNVPDLGRP